MVIEHRRTPNEGNVHSRCAPHCGACVGSMDIVGMAHTTRGDALERLAA